MPRLFHLQPALPVNSSTVCRKQRIHQPLHYSPQQESTYKLLLGLLWPFCPVAPELTELGNIRLYFNFIGFITWLSMTLLSFISEKMLICLCFITENYALRKSLVIHMEKSFLSTRRDPKATTISPSLLEKYFGEETQLNKDCAICSVQCFQLRDVFLIR